MRYRYPVQRCCGISGVTTEQKDGVKHGNDTDKVGLCELFKHQLCVWSHLQCCVYGPPSVPVVNKFYLSSAIFTTLSSKSTTDSTNGMQRDRLSSGP
jgi:hypothetical protein